MALSPQPSLSTTTFCSTSLVSDHGHTTTTTACIATTVTATPSPLTALRCLPRKQKILGLNPACARIFPGRVIPLT